MRESLLLLAPVLLAGQAALVNWAGLEHPPAVPVARVVPQRIGKWQQVSEIPVADEVQNQLRADRLWNRGYYDSASGTGAGLFIAWFQSQRNGARQPHSPKVCLPGAGWTQAASGEVEIQTPSGPLRANQYEVVRDGERSVVLYWYQSHRRALASEWAAKFWLAGDALRDQRTDTALVRIMVPATPKHPDAAPPAADFARVLYPVLRASLP